MANDIPNSGDPGQKTFSGVTTGVEVGTRINNNYEIEQIISAGGMGEVYRGVNYHTGDPVAIKIVLPSLAHDEKIMALFRREARILSKLAHENIVRYYNFIKDPDLDRFCLIMEFVEGTPLGDHLKANGPLSLEDARLLTRVLASGLEKAHKAEVTHRDLSPDNVILEGNQIEQAKIIDFGIAKSSSITEGTLHGQFAGKFNFVSPEQLGHFQGHIDARSDIYSLGLLAAAACRGEALKMGTSIVEAVNTRRSVPELEGVYEEMVPLLSHMLQPDPANRPQSMTAVLQMLDQTIKIPQAPEPVDDQNKTVVIRSLPPIEKMLTPKDGGTLPPQDGASPTAETVLTQEPVSAPPPPEIPPAETSLPTPPPPAAPVAQQESIDDLFGLAPASAAPRAAIKLPQKKKGKGGQIAVILILLLGLGGGGAYFAGLLDPLMKQVGTTVPKVPEASEDKAPPEDPETAETQPAPPQEEETPPVPAPAPPVQLPEPEQVAEPARPQPAPPQDEKPIQAESFLDAVTRYRNWVSDYETGSCSYKIVRSASEDKIRIEGFGPSVQPFEGLMNDFKAAHGIEPDIGFRRVLDAQCDILGFLNMLDISGRPAPQLKLDKDVLKSGEGIKGTVSGIGGRPVWLFLVSGQGGVYNLTSRLKLGEDGVGHFKFNMRLTKGKEPTPQLIVALTSRQPLISAKSAKNGTAVGGLVRLVETEIDTTPNMEPAASIRYFKLDN